jgi:hypothetical protein
MNLANKSFKNIATGEIVKVIDSFENIAILENRGKESVDKLLNVNHYIEHIDPTGFFNNQNSYNFLADKIKNINTNNIKDDDSGEIVVNVGDGLRPVINESAVVAYDPEDEKRELARKYNINPQDAINKQNEIFSKLLEEEPIQKVDSNQSVKVKQVNIVNQEEVYQQPLQNDPIIQMFKNVKRNVDFEMNIKLINKIPRLDFIEMMEDSYETSIIDFLADEFTKNILKDPNIIKEMISDKIKQIVYGGEISKNENKSLDEKKVVKTKPKTEVKTKPKTFVKPPIPTEDRILKEGETPRKQKIKKETSNND